MKFRKNEIEFIFLEFPQNFITNSRYESFVSKTGEFNGKSFLKTLFQICVTNLSSQKREILIKLQRKRQTTSYGKAGLGCHWQKFY